MAIPSTALEPIWMLGSCGRVTLSGLIFLLPLLERGSFLQASLRLTEACTVLAVVLDVWNLIAPGQCGFSILYRPSLVLVSFRLKRVGKASVGFPSGTISAYHPSVLNFTSPR